MLIRCESDQQTLLTLVTPVMTSKISNPVKNSSLSETFSAETVSLKSTSATLQRSAHIRKPPSRFECRGP